MRYKEFTESERQKTPQRLIPDVPQDEEAIAEKLATYIKQHAKKWLSLSNNGELVVYRGTRSSPPPASGPRKPEPYFIKDTKIDRPPRDTALDVHLAYNAMIKAVGGIANRNNSIFVSGNKPTAQAYGVTYVLIPLGEFHWTWSPEWDDWTFDVRTDNLGKLLRPDLVTKQTQDLGKFLSGEYDNSTDRGGEIINYTDPNNYNRRVLKDKILVDKDMHKAIQSGHEIMINASSGMYIDPDIYQKVIPLLQESN